jgi:adenine specific DNA methylase Mod
MGGSLTGPWPPSLALNRFSRIGFPKEPKGPRMSNHLFYGDNLSVLRESIRDESVDLIYLDPPFNSNVGYNVLF